MKYVIFKIDKSTPDVERAKKSMNMLMLDNGNIPGDGLALYQYIQDAFKYEFKMNYIHGDQEYVMSVWQWLMDNDTSSLDARFGTLSHWDGDGVGIKIYAE